MNRGTWKIVGARVVSPLRARNLMGHSKNLPVSKRRRRRPSLDAATRSSSVLHAARFDSARLAGFHSLLLKHNPRVSSRQFVLRDPGRVSPKHTLSFFFFSLFRRNICSRAFTNWIASVHAFGLYRKASCVRRISYASKKYSVSLGKPFEDHVVRTAVSLSPFFKIKLLYGVRRCLSTSTWLFDCAFSSSSFSL